MGVGIKDYNQKKYDWVILEKQNKNKKGKIMTFWSNSMNLKDQSGAYDWRNYMCYTVMHKKWKHGRSMGIM